MTAYGKAKNILKDYPGFATDFDKANGIECYKALHNGHYQYHTDALGDLLDWDELIDTDNVVVDWTLMDKEEYDRTVAANCCVSWDDIYCDGDKVLIVLYSEPETEEDVD